MPALTPLPTDALVLIDIQNDFCPGGRLAVAEGDAVVPVANRLIPRFSTVVLAQDWHPAGHRSFASAHPGRQPFEQATFDYGPQTLWPDHCVQETPGAAFHPELAVAPEHLVLRKGFRPGIDSYSAFYENDRTTDTGLAGQLRERGVKRVFLAGLATDYCVAFSAEDALRSGFETILVEDGCRGIDPAGCVAAKERLAKAGVRIVSSGDIG